MWIRDYNHGSRHPSVSRDNSERLGWFSVLFGAASGVAQQPNPGVTISAAVAADVAADNHGAIIRIYME